MHYYLIIAFQAFCIYHVIKKRNEYYWILLIIFLPLVGCLIYLFTQVLNRNNIESVQRDISNTIQPTRKIKELEKKLQFSETYANRLELADAYFDLKDYNNAVSEYLKVLEDPIQDGTYAQQKLIEAYYHLDQFEEIISYSTSLKDQKAFDTPKVNYYYGYALMKTGKVDEAEEALKSIDRPYSNYNERLMLAKFYLSQDRKEEARTLLNELSSESANLTKDNRRKFRATMLEVERVLKSL
ncbi:hypothetical protein Q2T40_14460 [Winogradskyella maritima]|uniref:Tetratricopeptide repeat protein n=1 Tax=Winogradskyella maritima TaxID=1517766 RepID=A0ABV8AGY0_9FLAO|nr:hypothetical protein [Winogradskyella maritima]